MFVRFVLLSKKGGPHNRTGGLSISVCSRDGRVLGGALGERLVAASFFQVSPLFSFISFPHPSTYMCVVFLKKVHAFFKSLLSAWWQSLVAGRCMQRCLWWLITPIKIVNSQILLKLPHYIQFPTCSKIFCFTVLLLPLTRSFAYFSCQHEDSSASQHFPTMHGK